MSAAPQLLRRRENGMEVWTTRQPDGSFLIEQRQDVGAAIDLNKKMANENDGYSRDRNLKRQAHIPDIIVMKWLNEDGLNVYDPDHADAVWKRLHDPDWRYLLTAPGDIVAPLKKAH
ncbi:hypothetical protein [Azospirillum picis]|uniref:Uncharacterized protein n=1 Tax=Azospirillum picis TaxID=488438 RepID=A0ABU0MPK7_9PROT|nr:hypothetical protein [Azospirillum picis]MBP2301570.1 hypothetical protein [Azospirillum picis]MDQ0535402.1 hypothetical protein [Azospirillum picis]